MAQIVRIRTLGGMSSFLTFRTNAMWEQKVHIRGTGLNKTLTGSGENKLHWSLPLGNRQGSWWVRAWYKSPGSNTWTPSDLKVFGFMHGPIRGQRAGANDGGGDQDYNDADVTVVSVGLPFKIDRDAPGIQIDALGPEEFSEDHSDIASIKP